MDRTRVVALVIALAAATGAAGISHVHAYDGSALLAQAAQPPEPGRAEHGPRGPGANRPPAPRA